MKLVALILGVGLLGCSGAAFEYDPAPAATTLAVTDPALVESVVSAVDVWQAGTSGAYQANVVLVDACPAGSWCIVSTAHIDSCGPTAAARRSDESIGACTDRHTHQTAIWAGVPAELLVSLISHDIGHQNGLPDIQGGGLMDPDRSDFASDAVSIDPATLAAFRASL
jgi:hypothetical protein